MIARTDLFVSVYRPAALPRHCYVVLRYTLDGAHADCWQVPVTMAGASVDWARRRKVDLPAADRLGAAVHDGPLLRSFSAALLAEGGPHWVALHGGPIIGRAASEAEALSVCEAQGFAPVDPSSGGLVDFYDAEDGPHVQGYEPDGFGVWIVACGASGSSTRG